MRGSVIVFIAVAAIGCGSSRPPMPAQACYASAPAQPRYAALNADNKITVAALFGQMDHKQHIDLDHGTWSARSLRKALVDMGYVQTRDEQATGRSQYKKHVGAELTVVVDVIGPRSLPHRRGDIFTAPVLARAIANHEVVYFNGHSFEGRLHSLRRPHELPTEDYRVLVLDTCWSQQYYSVPLVQARTHYHVISNTERSVTGSVDSFVDLLDGLVHAAATHSETSWQQLIAPMNKLAAERAAHRIRHNAPTKYAAPEIYGLSALCEPG